jgi:ubiquinone/menaquinone biosynthesis C-methylase UbiE
VTRALAGRFDRVVGVDISTEMLTQARELNASTTNVEFVHNTVADLAFVGDRRFDLVYSRHVLQHLPDRDLAGVYLSEMVRIVRPGGLVLAHLPLKIAARHRLLVVRRAYELLRRFGISADTLYTRLKLHPVSMLSVPEEQIRAWVEQAGGRVLAVDSKQGAVLSANVYITRDRA